MTFLADENFPGFAVRQLRGAGYSVDWIAESHPGVSDVDVLKIAAQRSAILLTLDKDFGELSMYSDLPPGCGIVLMRIADSDPDAFLRRILESLELRLEFQGHITVIGRDRIRTRPLRRPPASAGPFRP